MEFSFKAPCSEDAPTIADLARRLESSHKELEAFSYSISHDLRAPLRHVDSYSGLLRDHLGAGLDKTGQHYLDVILQATKRMGQLIDDLLSFSRISRVDMAMGPVSLNQLICEVLQDVAPEEAPPRVMWCVGALPCVHGDVKLLRLVFTNLFDNAVKFSRPRKSPMIEVNGDGEKDGHAVVFVRDNGVGFDMRYAEKVFGVFQRLYASDEFEGTGMGLAHVQRIVQRHGGRAWAQAAPDQGATFYVALPTMAAGATSS